MQPIVALPPDCCHYVVLAPERHHRRAPTSRTCHSCAAMTPAAVSSSSCLHHTSIFCNSRPPSCHHRATIAPPYSRSFMLPHVRTACSFIHVADNHHCCDTSESCSSQRELRCVVLAPPSKLWKPLRVRHGSHHEFTLAPSSRSRQNCVDPVHFCTVVDDIASMAATAITTIISLEPLTAAKP